MTFDVNVQKGKEKAWQIIIQGIKKYIIIGV